MNGTDSCHSKEWPRRYSRPINYLTSAEKYAVEGRKLIQEYRSVVNTPKLADNVVAIAKTIEALCQFGRRATAVEATAIEEKVELLIDQLDEAIDSLVSAHGRTVVVHSSE